MTEIIHKCSELEEKIKEEDTLRTDKDLLQLQVL